MKKNNILVIVLTIVIIGLSSFIIYDKVLSNDKDNAIDDNANIENNSINNDDKNAENSTDNYKDYTEDCSIDDTKCTISYTFETDQNYTSIVEAKDTFAITNDPMFGESFFILNDGALYYDIEKCTEGYCNYINYNLGTNSYNFLSELNKFTDITNIKRIKSYNPSSGTDWALFLITNEGEVHSLRYSTLDNKITTTKVEEFDKYKVDNIIKYNFSVPFGAEYKLILNDGTTLTKTINTNN